MKRNWCLGFVVLLCALVFAGPASAIPTYWMDVTAGKLYTDGDAVGSMNTDLTGLGHSIPSFGGGSAFDISGWWEFNVTGSTTNTPGSNWNDVFAGGWWYFQTTWGGSIHKPTGPTVTIDPPVQFMQYGSWAGMYGKWFENNSQAYTYFSLYVPEGSGGASDESVAPVGVFAFAIDSNSYPYYDFTNLRNTGAWNVGPGEGIATATFVPEPATMLLLSLGLFGLAGVRRRFQS
jgi:hypothetical protein